MKWNGIDMGPRRLLPEPPPEVTAPVTREYRYWHGYPVGTLRRVGRHWEVRTETSWVTVRACAF